MKLTLKLMLLDSENPTDPDNPVALLAQASTLVPAALLRALKGAAAAPLSSITPPQALPSASASATLTVKLFAEARAFGAALNYSLPELLHLFSLNASVPLEARLLRHTALVIRRRFERSSVQGTALAELLLVQSAEAWSGINAAMAGLVETLRGSGGGAQRSFAEVFNEALQYKEGDVVLSSSSSSSSTSGSSSGGGGLMLGGGASSGGGGSWGGGSSTVEIPVGLIPLSRLVRYLTSKVPREGAAVLEATLLEKARCKFAVRKPTLSKKEEEAAAAAAAAAAKAAQAAGKLAPETAAPCIDKASALLAYEVSYTNLVALLQSTLVDLGAWRGEAERNWRQLNANATAVGGQRTPHSGRSGSGSPRHRLPRRPASSNAGFTVLPGADAGTSEGKDYGGGYTPLLALTPGILPAAAAAAAGASARPPNVRVAAAAVAAAAATRVEGMLASARQLQREQREALGLRAFCQPLVSHRNACRFNACTLAPGTIIPLEVRQAPALVTTPPLAGSASCLETRQGASGWVQRALEAKSGDIPSKDGVGTFGREHSTEETLVNAGYTDSGSVLSAPHELFLQAAGGAEPAAYVWLMQLQVRQEPLPSEASGSCYEGKPGEVLLALGCLPHTLSPLSPPALATANEGPLSSALLCASSSLYVVLSAEGHPVLQGSAMPVQSGDVLACRVDVRSEGSAVLTVELHRKATAGASVPSAAAHKFTATLQHQQQQQQQQQGSAAAWLPACWYRATHRPSAYSITPTWILAPRLERDAPFPPSLLPPAWRLREPLAAAPSSTSLIPWDSLLPLPMLSPGSAAPGPACQWLSDLAASVQHAAVHAPLVSPSLWGNWLCLQAAEGTSLVCLPLRDERERAAVVGRGARAGSGSSGRRALQWRPVLADGSAVLGEEALTVRLTRGVGERRRVASDTEEFPYKQSRSYAAPLGVSIQRGKWYYECTVLRLGAEGIMVGWGEVGGTPQLSPAYLLSAKVMLGKEPGAFFSTVRWPSSGGQQFHMVGDGMCRAGDVLCCALDADEGVARWGKNGVFEHPWGACAIRVKSAHGLAPLAMLSLMPSETQGGVTEHTRGETTAAAAAVFNLGSAQGGGGFKYPPPLATAPWLTLPPRSPHACPPQQLLPVLRRQCPLLPPSRLWWSPRMPLALGTCCCPCPWAFPSSAPWTAPLTPSTCRRCWRRQRTGCPRPPTSRPPPPLPPPVAPPLTLLQRSARPGRPSLPVAPPF